MTMTYSCFAFYVVIKEGLFCCCWKTSKAKIHQIVLHGKFFGIFVVMMKIKISPQDPQVSLFIE